MLQISIIISFAIYLIDMWFLKNFEIRTGIHKVDKLLNCCYCLSFWMTFFSLTFVFGFSLNNIVFAIGAYWLQVIFQKNSPFF